MFYDARWQHVATCDFTHLVVGEARDAVHSGDLTSAPAPLGASEFVDLHLDRLAARRARFAVMVVFSYNAVSFDRLTHGFAGLMHRPVDGEAFQPRAVVQRFDLHGKSMITVPLVIDLAARRLRWLDVHVRDRGSLHEAGGYRAALAHLGRDFADFIASGARPTLWDVAAIHAAARANTIYVRDGAFFVTYKRRDNETTVARLARMMVSDHDGATKLPAAHAPTWFALLRDDLALPAGSEGYALDTRGSSEGITRLAAADLVAALAPRP